MGKGSTGGGVLHWARLLTYSPAIDMVLLDGEDIRKDRLREVNVLIVPGGSSAGQYRGVNESGAENIRAFLREGRVYIGICAGLHCVLERPDRFRILPYKFYHAAVGRSALVEVDISEEGGKLLGIKPGRRQVQYSLGPIYRAGEKWAHAGGESFAVYKSSVGPVGRAGVSFCNYPAALWGYHGKGKVIACSFHSEYHVGIYDIAMGMVYAATGVKTFPEFPRKDPVRVAFMGVVNSKQPVLRMLELDRHSELDLSFVSTGDLHEGVLEHSDVLVVPYIGKWFGGVVRKYREVLIGFMERGGRIVAGGCEKDRLLLKHKNLVMSHFL